MRKLSVLFIVMIMFLSVAAGCAKSSPNTTAADSPNKDANTTAANTDSPKPDAPKKQDPKEITVSYNQGEFSWPAFQKMADAYKAKTGNTVKFKYIPAAEYDKWIQTQFIGGSEPEIVMSAGGDKASWFKNGWIVDMMPYLDQDSPYTSKKWNDSFLTGVIDSAADKTDTAKPKLYGIPYGLVAVNLYYNKDIFDKIGVAKPPATITEFLDVLKKAKDKGYIGFSIQNSMDWNLSWLASDVWETLWRAKLAILDLNKNGRLEQGEWAVAVKNGVVTADSPEFKDYMRLMKDLAPYFNTGFNTASWEFEGLFNDGKSAMTLNGSWYPNQNVQGKFPVKYGIAPIPYVDKAYSPLGDSERHKYLSGGGPDIAVTRKAKENGSLDAAVDFLRFWTDPNGGAKIMTDELYTIPVVKGVKVPDLLNPVMESFGSETPVEFHGNDFTPEQKDIWLKSQQQYLDGKLTADQWLKGYAKDLNMYVDKAIKAHPEWKVEDSIKK